jgi:parallel beta-helix repeat protein
MLRVAFGSVLVLALASSASAETLRVPNQFESIQEALEAAGPGDTVAIAPGSYEIVGGLVLGPGRDGVSIRGQGRVFLDGPLPDPEGDVPPALRIESSGVSLRNLVFRHAEDDAIVVGTEEAPVDGFRMDRCNVRNARRSGLVVFGDRVVVRGCRFRGCNQGAIEMTGSGLEVTRSRMEQLGAFGMRLTGDGLVYVRNVMRTVEDGRGLEATGNDILVDRSTFFGVQRQHVNVVGDGATVRRCSFSLGDRGAIDISGRDASVERNRIEAFGNTAIAILGSGSSVQRNQLQDIGSIDSDFDDDFFGELPDNEGDPNCGTDNGRCDTDAMAIAVYGDDVEVARNDMRGLGRRGIFVEGDRAAVAGNRVIHSTRSALRVVGVDVRVVGNIVFSGDSGISVFGDGCRVTDNDVLAAGDDATGMVVGGDGAVVSDNKVKDANGNGLQFSGFDAVIEGNVVATCGAENERGLSVSGSRNRITGNRVTGCDATGLQIQGSENVAIGNRLEDNSDNGIRIVERFEDGPSTGNRLERNVCRDNAGEGIENEGIDTVIRSNDVRGNRTDLANAVSLGATLVDEGGNRFQTGGAETEPRVGISR